MSRSRIAGIVASPLLLYLVFVPLPMAWRSAFLWGLFDLLHFVVAAGFCWFLAARCRWSTESVVVALVAVAVMCEVLQMATGRHASAVDVLRGVAGGLAMLVWLWAGRSGLPLARRVGAAVAVVALSAWPISEFLVLTARLCAHSLSGMG